MGAIVGEDIAQTTLSRWENGMVDFSFEQVRAIKLALGVIAGTLGIAAGYVELTDPPPHVHEIKAMFLSTEEDTYECLRAAATLGLGFRLHNRWVEHDDDTIEEERVFELLGDPALCVPKRDQSGRNTVGVRSTDRLLLLRERVLARSCGLRHAES